MELNKALDSINIADSLDKDQLIKIGNQVVSGYETDCDSRKPWEEDLKNWTDLALQVTSTKTFPWPNAANIKYPLLATAAMQFAARAYPTLIPSNGKLVKCRVIGSDMDGQKTARANRISTHMSYQLLDEMDGWEEDMDKLLISLPIAGTCFKKTYWDSAKQKNCSKLVLPKTLVVNYYCRNLDDAERITEILHLTKRKIKERQNQGIYLEVDIGDPSADSLDPTTSVNGAFQRTANDDETTPYVILEQHTYLDLDEDGYSEPYIVTVEEASKKVLRIVPRFDSDGVVVGENGKIVSIEAIQYYTKYGFIPNPDGGFYDIGFGRLLGPLNNSANTIINQLVDAGSLSNLQAGFIGKGLRIKMGESRFQPGEWKAVNAVGDDLKKQIFPLPVREPSQVLFNLLDLLLKSGKELASVAEIFVGKMPGQNTPATTTMASIEQGMKLFTAVYKRVYRSLAKEFQKIYKLNRIYLDPQVELEILDEPVEQSDYLGNEKDVIPSADPSAASSQERIQKAQQLMQLLGLGTINPMVVTQRMLEALEEPAPEQLMQQPQPQPDPKAEALKMKAQLDMQTAQHDMALKEKEMQLKQAGESHKAQIQKALADQKLEFQAQEAALKMRIASMEANSQQQSHVQSLQQADDNHKMSLVQGVQKHQQQLKQQKEVQRAKPQKPKK